MAVRRVQGAQNKAMTRREKAGSTMELYYDDKTKKQQIHNFYQLIFDDPESFASYYFDEMYPQNRCLLLEKEGDIAGMLHQNPYEVAIGDKCFWLSYIVAVSTRKELRRQGCMRKLLCKTMEDLAKRGEPFTYLMPAKKEYYEPFDFAFVMDWHIFHTPKWEEEQGERKGKSELVLEIQTEQTIDFLVQKMNEQRVERANVFTKMSRPLLERLEKEQNCENGHIFLIKRKEDCIATGMYTMAEGEVQITNLLIDSMEQKEEIISFLRETFSTYDIEWISNDRNFIPIDEWNEKRKTEREDKKEQEKHQYERKPLIMARILRVDLLLPLIKSTKNGTIVIEIKDDYLPHNRGTFLWKTGKDGSTLERTSRQAQLSVDIAKLTSIVFGYEKINNPYLKNVIPLCPVYITEVV